MPLSPNLNCFEENPKATEPRRRWEGARARRGARTGPGQWREGPPAFPAPSPSALPGATSACRALSWGQGARTGSC